MILLSKSLSLIFISSMCFTLFACGGGSSDGGAEDDGGDATATYIVTITQSENGTTSITSAEVNENESVSFTVIADTGYVITSVSGCDGSLMGNTYTTGAVTADCTVTASFVADATFFVATNGSNGDELFITDGTDVGTVMIKDINIGGNSRPENFEKVNGMLFFSANDGINGRELWKSDGTAVGTVMVKDINVTSALASSSPYRMINVGGTLFFIANDGVTGRELWKSDGTDAGTVLVKDINGLGDSARSSGVRDRFVVLGGMLYFTADDGVNDRQLWQSDGTELGTVMVKNFSPGFVNAPIVISNNTLFFSASDGVNGTELWKSDGTDIGTIMLTDIRTSFGTDDITFGALPTDMADVNGKLFFSATTDADIELWTSDEISTRQLFNISPGASSRPTNFTDVNGVLFFSADDGNGTSLWMHDATGTGNGAFIVRERINGGPQSARSLIAMNGLLLFQGRDPTSGRELWVSDGTDTGTKVLKDIAAGASNSDADPWSSFNQYMPIMLPDGRLLFGASNATNGREPWVTDGTEAGTLLLKDINPDVGNSFYVISN